MKNNIISRFLIKKIRSVILFRALLLICLFGTMTPLFPLTKIVLKLSANNFLIWNTIKSGELHEVFK